MSTTRPAPRFDDPALRDAIMREFLTGVHPANIAIAHQLTLSDLLAWWDHPQVQADLSRLRELLEAQRLLATLAVAPECAAILMNVARSAPGTETARKAAAQLLRALGPATQRPDRAANHQRAQPRVSPPAPHSVTQTLAPNEPIPTEPLRSDVLASQPPPSEPWSSTLVDELLAAPSHESSRLVCHDV
jgi:hypothetical protein